MTSASKFNIEPNVGIFEVSAKTSQLGTLSATFEITRRSPVASTSRENCYFDVHASRRFAAVNVVLNLPIVKNHLCYNPCTHSKTQGWDVGKAIENLNGRALLYLKPVSGVRSRGPWVCFTLQYPCFSMGVSVCCRNSEWGVQEGHTRISRIGSVVQSQPVRGCLKSVRACRT